MTTIGAMRQAKDWIAERPADREISAGKMVSILIDAIAAEEAQTVEPDHIADPRKIVSGDREALIDNLRAMSVTVGDARKAADMLAADAQWEKLCDPVILHANLLRGLPAQLSKEQLLHLLGTDAPAEPVQQVAVPQKCPRCSHEQTDVMVHCGNCAQEYEAAPQPPQADTKKSGDAHEIWAAAQIAPGEGIADGVARVEALLGAPRVPMTEPEINKMYSLIPKTDDVVFELVRAVEAHYGITNEQK